MAISGGRELVADMIGHRWPGMVGEVLAGARSPGRRATVVIIEGNNCIVRELVPPDPTPN